MRQTSIVNCIFLNQGAPGMLTNAHVVSNVCYNAGRTLASTAIQSNNATSTTGILFVDPASDWHRQSVRLLQ